MILRPLNVLQLNVARSNVRMHAILNTLTDFDILLLQEPWYGRIGVARSSTDAQGLDIKGTVANPAWDLFIPESTADGPPRVATFIRKGIPSLDTRPCPDLIGSKDILTINVTYGGVSCFIVNVYNAGTGRDADSVNRICNTNFDPLVPTAIAGDFNLHHPEWALEQRAARPTSTAAIELAEWLISNSFAVANSRITPTRRGRTNQADSIIDLTLFNYAATDEHIFRSWACSEELSFDSDHNGVTWTIHPPDESPDTNTDTDAGIRIDPSKKPEWCAAFTTAIYSSPMPARFLSTADIDQGAKALLDALITATSTTMPHRTNRVLRRAKWWNNDCDQAFHDLRHASPADRTHARSHFRAAVRSAKRNWAADIIKNTPQPEVWKLCHWAAGRPNRRIPPTRTPNGLTADPEAQSRAFATSFFPSTAPQVPIHLPDDPPPLPPRQFSPLTPDEIRDALTETSNTTAPGKSGITWRLIKWAFGISSLEITSLFNACLEFGHHPSSLKTAVISVVPKPRKADMSDPRSYRPISLLECLSKLLEKVIARRLIFEIGKFNLVPTNQFGGRDKSSVIDACLSLTHDIQAAWKNGLVASALAIDIKGYFNHVNHSRLIHTLHLLGFAPQLVSWLRSFLHERSIIMRIGKHLSHPIPIAGVGIPQGSPLSPVLSTIYTFNVLPCLSDISNSDLKAYIDDVLLLAVSHSLEGNVDKLTRAFNTVTHQLIALGLDIDADKTELIHFTRSRSNPSLDPLINISPPNAPARTIRPTPVMRWLGVFFDRKLSFKKHVEIMATRALSTISGLRILANSVRGLSVLNARLLYKTVVLPVLTFASPVWFTGVRQKSLIKPLERAQSEGLRWLLGAFRTSPISDMHHIGAILPIHILLQRLSMNAAIRFRTLPFSSQVLARTPSDWEEHSLSVPIPLPTVTASKSKPLTIIHHLASLTTPTAERLFPYHTPPWSRHHPWDNRLRKTIPNPQMTQRERMEYIRSVKTRIHNTLQDPTTLLVFTDGSRHRASGQRRTGAGYVAFLEGHEVRTGCWGLGKRAGVYDAEMFALAGSAGAMTHILAQNPHIKHLLFLSDNQAALSTITDTTAHPAQGASILFRRHVDNLLLTSNPFDVELIWIPGHKGIFGNERADGIAKAAVNLRPIFASTISWAREKAKSRALKTWRTDWASRSHTNLAATALTTPPSTKLSPFHRFFNGTRATHSRIIQTLLGHFFCGEYYARFVPTESVSCPCGHPHQTRAHILTECPNFDAYRHHLRAASRTLSLPVILGTKSGLEALAKFVAESHAFSKDVPGGFADHG